MTRGKTAYIPPARRVDPGAVVARIKQRENRWRKIVLSFLIGGALFSLVAPLLVTAVTWLFGRMDRPPRHVSLPLTFSACVLIILPLTYLIEYVSRGRFLEETAGNLSDTPMFFIRGRAMVAVLVLESWLWGPRMVLSGLNRLRKTQNAVGGDYQMAGKIVCRLLGSEGGMPSSELLDGLPEDDAVTALTYLICYEWVGMSKDGKRIWLDSDARKLVEPQDSR